jgi:prepilin-type N-terminal cleavage/methylation domain-containing protein
MSTHIGKPIGSNRGFTLLEGIVTAIILGILSAVAIPQYTSYVASSKQEAVNNLAATASVAANLYFRRTGDEPEASDLHLFYDANKFEVEVDGHNVIVSLADGSITSGNVQYH